MTRSACGSEADMAVLEFKDITVQFGGVTAINSASIAVEQEGVHGLIGPNGAGKSTLFNVACGLVRPKRGAVLLDGTDVTRLGPHKRARLRMGLIVSDQVASLLPLQISQKLQRSPRP